MWTAWDYLGETGLGGWSTESYTQRKAYPWLIADTGALDILGNPTGEAALAKSVWGFSNSPMMAENCDGNLTFKVKSEHGLTSSIKYS